MSNQEDIDSINNRLYSFDVPSEPIKKIMFYFSVLKEVIDFPFPQNYINYEHPYFASYEQMEDFFELSRSLDPAFLYYNNVIIYHNDKSYYKYYQLNNDEEGIPYEFKVVNNEESANPIFNDNYDNTFNISNIDKNQKEFHIKVSNKCIILHSDENAENIPEDDYLNDAKEEKKIDINYQKTNHIDSIDEIVDSESDDNDYEQNPKKNSKKNKTKNKSKNKSKKSKKRKKKKRRSKKDMNSEDELDDSEEEFHIEKVKIKHRLIVTNDWINFIYNSTQKELLPNMKRAVKKDEIREKSIKLPKNVFFYLEIFMLVALAICSWVLFSMSTTLISDGRFQSYKKLNESLNLTIPIDLNGKIDYKNDSFIIPEIKKYNKINKGCKLGQTSSIFATIFLIFLIYMCIRVAREKKRKYQKKDKAKKAGLNICHFVVFILLTLLALILTLVAEIYISISLSQKTYVYFHNMARNQLIANSALLVCYVIIIVFYCKI